jgi:hypothetical protein
MAKGFHLTLMMGPAVPLPALPEVVDALQSAQVTVTSGQRSGFQFTFGLAKNGVIQRELLPIGLFDPGIRMILAANFGTLPTVLMDGIVTRQEVSPGNAPGQGTLTVTGEDVSLMMDVEERRGVPYPNMPAGTRVMMIVAKYFLYGMVPIVVPQIFPFVPLATQSIPFQEGTDLAYLKKLADENGYVFYVEPGPAPGMNRAYWGPEVRVGIPQPALSVNMDVHTNVESLTFSYDGTSRKQVALNVQEPITKQTIPIPLPEIGILNPPLAARQAASLRYEYLEGTAKDNPMEAMAKGLAKASASSDAISASGSLDVLRYGRPLSARGLVGVRGAGLAYDGLYYVKSVTHKLKRGEYKQNFTLVRNGLVSTVPAVRP